MPGYAETLHPQWLQESLDKADKLNDKNPVLALEFTQDLLANHNDQLSTPGKAALIARLAEYQYYLGHNEKSLKNIELFYTLSPDLNTFDGISVLITHGGILDGLAKPKEAMKLYLQAEAIAKAIESKKLLAETYGSIAGSFARINNDSEALKYYHQAYLHLEAIGDKLEMAYLKIQMSISYSNIFDDKNAIKLAKEAISYFKNNEYIFDELFGHSTLARIFMAVKDYDSAITEYQQVMALSQQVGKDSLIEVAYIGLAKAFHWKKQHDKARHYFNLYQQVHQHSDSPFAQIDDLVLSASISIAEQDISSAVQSLKYADELLLTLEKNSVLSWRIKVLDLKAELAIFNQDYQSAFQLQKEARKLVSSYQNIEREKIRSKYKVMFDIDQALLQNQLLERDKQLDKAALESALQQQRLHSLVIAGISLFALILTFFILRQVKNSKTLHKLANTDTLTELANRRYTFASAEKLIVQAKISKQDFTIIIFDIDHFKAVNDTFGHTGGDIALKTIATIANIHVRNHDILGRIGGEEFLVVLPGTSVQQAYEVAERIRHAIKDKDIMLKGKVVNISASFGIAQLAKQHDNFNQLFHQADIALYQAKDSGRNCIKLAQ